MGSVVTGHQPFQRAASLYIRFAVFVLEHGIDRADEFDDYDEKGTVYTVVYEGQQPVATGRFLPLAEDEARLTRIATLEEYRGKGYGTQVVAALEDHALAHGYHQLIIHSELPAKTFYQSLSYRPIGEIYVEDGIPCQSLVKYLEDKTTNELAE